MIVLGVANTKDSGACLLVDGKLVAAVSEERFTRQKLIQTFPLKSVDWVLKSQGLSVKDIGAVALGAWKAVAQGVDADVFAGYVGRTVDRSTEPDAARLILNRVSSSLASDRSRLEEFRSGLTQTGLDRVPLHHCDHHEAHAYSAFYFSPFNQALVVTLDGRGDFRSGSVSQGKRGARLKLLRTETDLDSFGFFYGWITNFLGFTPDRHEGKVTGLAGRGDPSRCIASIRKMLSVVAGEVCGAVGACYGPWSKAQLPALARELEKHSREDVAAAAQAMLEEWVCAYVRFYIDKSGERNLCLAGGIFANVQLNRRLRELPGVEAIYVFPSMGDGGVPAGAAAHCAVSRFQAVVPLSSALLGPEYDAKAIEKAAGGHGLLVAKFESLDVAAAINAGKIVGLFSGRMEYGPRALGSRSIIASAKDTTINDWLNKRLNRSEFMPFAPVILETDAPSCLEGWSPSEATSRYMTCCFPCTEAMKAHSPAVVHVDGTARPQVIGADANPAYHEILSDYKRMTKLGVLINTSFNRHEEPIVCTPEDAISTLLDGSIDMLAAPPYLIAAK